MPGEYCAASAVQQRHVEEGRLQSEPPTPSRGPRANRLPTGECRWSTPETHHRARRGAPLRTPDAKSLSEKVERKLRSEGYDRPDFHNLRFSVRVSSFFEPFPTGSPSRGPRASKPLGYGVILHPCSFSIFVRNGEPPAHVSWCESAFGGFSHPPSRESLPESSALPLLFIRNGEASLMCPA